MKIHKFEDSLLKSKYYEEEIIKNFNKLDKRKKVLDVTEDEKYQEIDVDFIYDDIKYEIKADFQAHKSGNLTYEHVSRKLGLKVLGKGCFAKTEADIIIYTLTETGQTYFLDTKKLRKIVGKNLVEGLYTTREINNFLNDEIVKGEVIIVPFDSIKKAIIKVENYIFNPPKIIAEEEQNIISDIEKFAQKQKRD